MLLIKRIRHRGS